MSLLEARRAALKLQQALVEFDIDVVLKLQNLKNDRGATGFIELETAVLELDVGCGPAHPAIIYIAEDGSVWGKDTAWGAIFANNVMAFNTTTPWNVDAFAKCICSAVPNQRRFIEAQLRYLKQLSRLKRSK